MKIVGKKINLRTLVPSDARSIFENANDKNVSLYMGHMPYPYRLKDAGKFICRVQKVTKNKTGYRFGIEDKVTGKIIGSIGADNVDRQNKNVMIGYWLGKKYWHQGFCGEAVNLFLKFLFEKIKVNMVYAYAMKPNVASQKLLLKCGFRYDGKIRQRYLRKGKYLDSLCYTILKKEFKKIKV